MSANPRNYFDVVVLGSSPGGFVTAALLAKRGYRVAVIPDEHQVPTPLLIPGGRASPVLGWVFGQLGLTQEMRNRLRRLAPGCQVILPRHRFDLAGESVSSRAELERDLPGEDSVIGGWLESVAAARARTDGLLDPPPILPAETMRDSRAWKARLRSAEADGATPPDLSALHLTSGLTAGHALESVAGSSVRFLSLLRPAIRPGPGPPRLFSLLDQGVWIIKGGRVAFRELMEERLKTYGAALLNCGAVREIEPSWRGEVRVDTDKEPIAARVVVHAGDARGLPGLLPAGGKRRKLEAQVEGAKEVARCRVIRARAAAAARPSGLGPLAVSEPMDGGAPVLIRTVDHNDECVFSVVFEEPTNPDPGQAVPADRAWSLLLDVAPFLEDHLLDGPALDPATVPVYEAPPLGDGAGGGAADGGVSLLTHRTPYKQIFLAGHQVLPGLGLEGEFLAGVGCAELVARQVKRKDLLGR